MSVVLDPAVLTSHGARLCGYHIAFRTLRHCCFHMIRCRHFESMSMCLRCCVVCRVCIREIEECLIDGHVRLGHVVGLGVDPLNEADEGLLINVGPLHTALSRLLHLAVQQDIEWLRKLRQGRCVDLELFLSLANHEGDYLGLQSPEKNVIFSEHNTQSETSSEP